MTTTPTSGAADLPEALINIAREIEALKRDCGMDPESSIAIQNGRYMAISSKIRALAAGQATAAQAVAPEALDAIADSQYLAGVTAGFNAAQATGPSAALQKIHNSRTGYLKPLRAKAAAPAQPAAQQPHRSGCTAGTDEECVQRGCGTNCLAVSPQAAQQAPRDAERELEMTQQFNAGRQYEAGRIAARVAAAPAGATEEVENLRKALVYAAFALHDAPQYMLAQGITLIDGDTVRVSRDGWTVEASVNPHRQPAPATQQAGEAWQARASHGQAPAGAAHEADSAPAVGYPPLPNLDGSDEQIWEAISNWKTATPGADAVRKANKVKNAIIGTMRACVDADRAARAPADSVQEDAARYRFLRDGEWRDTDLEPFIRLQLNTLWDAKIDAARAAQEGGK